MTTNKTASLALLVELGDVYGQARLFARPVAVQRESGELHNCMWGIGGFDLGAELEGFTASAYVGYHDFGGRPDDLERGIWGCDFYADVTHMKTTQASRLARAMTRVTNSMDKQSKELGYLADNDFAGYVLRVAKAMRITKTYVRNTFRAAEMSGQLFRSVDGEGLQTYVGYAALAVKEMRTGEYVKTSRR